MIHNLKLAALLSFVAGVVNISGLKSVQFLTTNITGHFAFFSEGLVEDNFTVTAIFGFFVIAFFTGAFVSGMLMEFRANKGGVMIGSAPVILEIFLLAALAFFPNDVFADYPYAIASILLFSMGLQNALVTTISRSIVRTTHLTGLFTDLGIELSQLVFSKEERQQQKLFSSIKLHLSIIFSFLMGILIGGLVYFEIANKSFLLAAILLILGLVGRRIFLSAVKLKRQVRKH